MTYKSKSRVTTVDGCNSEALGGHFEDAATQALRESALRANEAARRLEGLRNSGATNEQLEEMGAIEEMKGLPGGASQVSP